MIDMRRCVGRNPTMQKTSIIVLASILSMVQLSGCKKDEAAKKDQDKSGEAASAAPAEGQTNSAEASQDGTSPAVTTQPTTANDKPKEATAPAPLAAPKHRLDITPLPKPNADGFFMMMQQAANSCLPSDTMCEPIKQLAARIPNSIKEVSKLAASGTDQQKSAIRKALLLTGDEAAHPLLLSYAIDKQGRLDKPVIEHAVELRISALIPVLRKYLDTSVGTDARNAIVAIGRIGGKKAHKALKEALNLPNAKPFIGDVCQALSRTGAADMLPAVKALGSRLDGSRRQREGCRNAESAFGIVGLPSSATVFLDGKQYPSVGLIAEQRAPRTVTLMFTDDSKATCENPGKRLLEVDIPLRWDGAPLLGTPLVGKVRIGANSLPDDTAYYTRVDALKLVIGERIEGIGFYSHVPSKGLHRLVMGGSFKGTYCGVAGQ